MILKRAYSLEAIALDVAPFLGPGEQVVHAVRVGAGTVTTSVPVNLDGVLIDAQMSVPSVFYVIVATDLSVYALRLEREFHRHRRPGAVFIKAALEEVQMRLNGDRLFIRTPEDPLERGFMVGIRFRRRAKRLVEYVDGA